MNTMIFLFHLNNLSLAISLTFTINLLNILIVKTTDQNLQKLKNNNINVLYYLKKFT